MTTEEKLKWLQQDFIQMLQTLPADAKGNWGVMNAQEMVEHLSDSARQGNGKSPRALLTPEDLVDRYKSFLVSDKPFKENTSNPGMPEIPVPLLKSNMQEAIEELKIEFNDLADYYKGAESKEVINPIFGPLNYEQWVQLLYKHSRHHARQFGLIPE
jgi:hypothetical protein